MQKIVIHKAVVTVRLALVVATGVIVLLVALWCLLVTLLPSQARQDYGFPLVGRYSFFRNSSVEHLIARLESRADDYWLGAVPGDVRELGWDDRFIVCRQYPIIRDAGMGSVIEASVPGGSYWIIDSTTETVFGPLNETMYNAKLQELPIRRPIALHSYRDYGRSGVLR